MSDVENFYSGKTIFITGVTGFLGQVLLSKLLCACPDLRCVYILIREKKGKRIHERFKALFDCSIFQQAKELHPDYETKVKPIAGDCYECNLGISETNRAIIESEVEIIFHAAATVRFDAQLREAVYINIRSTDTLLEMAKNMKNLKAFMYVSTAFSPCAERKLIEEKFYDTPIKAHNLLTMVEQLDDKILDSITSKLIKPHPNTYIYTKIIAEGLCRDKGSGLPLCIFRPSIVAPCFKEPAPGWINNFYGPVGVIIGYALGIIKAARADRCCKADMVPCDYAVNALIVSAFHSNEQRENGTGIEDCKAEPLIINYSNTTTKFSFTWGTFLGECDKALNKFPFYKNNIGDFLPISLINNNSTVYQCSIALFHLFPAFIIDTILSILGKKPRIKKQYEKIHKLFDLLTPFSTNEWVIPNINVDRIWAQLSQKDKNIFKFNLNDLILEEYFETYIRGLRYYIANDEDHTIEKAIKRKQIFSILRYAFAAIFILMFSYFLASLFF